MCTGEGQIAGCSVIMRQLDILSFYDISCGKSIAAQRCSMLIVFMTIFGTERNVTP